MLVKLKKLKFNESTISLLLGVGVILLAAAIAFNFFQSRTTERAPEIGETKEEGELTEATKAVSLPTTHEIKEGETLWSIAERYYSSGYNWVDINKDNKLANPNILYVGTKLTVPKATPLTPTTGALKPTVVESRITESTYTVVAADHLWSIAVRAYGDGYRWVGIAKANSLANPNLIHKGNVLKIPR